MKRALLLLCLASLPVLVHAQQLVQERIYCVHTTRTAVNTATISNQGNILFSGNFTVGIGGGYRHEYMLVKPNTDTLWTRRGVLFATGTHEIKPKPGGGYVFLGTVPNLPIPSNQGDLFLQGLHSNGMPQWQKTYNFNTYEHGQLLQIAPDSGYFLGAKGGFPGKQSPFSLLRTDSLGIMKWQKDFSWHNADALVDMQYTANGNLILAGFTYDNNLTRHLKLLLVNQNGDSLLGQQLPTVYSIQGEVMYYTYGSVTPLTDGGFLLTAQIDTMVNNLKKYRGMVVKVDANLQPVWRYIKYPILNNVQFTKARELTDGTLLVMGFTYPTATNTYYFYHFSAAGALLNVYNFTSSIATEVRAVTLDFLADSSFMIGGEATVTPLPNYTSGMYVAKVRFPSLPTVVPPIIISGIKQEIAIGKFGLGQSYPNPTAAEALIPYNLPKSYRKASIIIREIATGREIRKYELKSQKGNLTVDVSQLRNGLYLYSLVVDEKPVATKKLAVMK